MTLYRHDDHTHPSVTTVIGAMVAKPNLIQWAATLAANAALRGEPEAKYAWKHQGAAERGQAVHAWIARFLDRTPRAEHPTNPPPEGLEGYCEQATLAWDKLTDAGWIVEAVEQPLVNCQVGWAGTADCIIRRTSASLSSGVFEYAVLDWKTSPRIDRPPYPEHRLQVAAYASCPHLLDTGTGQSRPTPWGKVEQTCIVQISPHAFRLTGAHGPAVLEAGLLAAHLVAPYLWLGRQP